MPRGVERRCLGARSGNAEGWDARNQVSACIRTRFSRNPPKLIYFISSPSDESVRSSGGRMVATSSHEELLQVQKEERRESPETAC